MAWKCLWMQAPRQNHFYFYFAFDIDAKKIEDGEENVFWMF